MPAPQIPNLLDSLRTSRKARGGPAGIRGRGPQSQKPSDDTVVQQTDDDAAGSRLSAVEVGYLDDAFARSLASPQTQTGVRRMPVINRGTYVRTTAIDALVEDFSHTTTALTESSSKSGQLQIISLGAGTDSRFFRLTRRQNPSEAARLRYHEVDFPGTTRKKVDAIERSDFVHQLLKDCAACSNSTDQSDRSSLQISDDKTSISSHPYSLHGLDLRRLAQADAPMSDLLPGVEPNTPTLILSECCLTYLAVEAANAILSNLTRYLRTPSASPSSHAPTLAILLYEPLHPDDPFGRTMASNLSARGISLPSLASLPTFESHWQRLRGSFQAEKWGGMEVRRWWEGRVSAEEKDRLRRVEGLDEEEEWELLAGHYGFIWGWSGRDPGALWGVAGGG